MRQTVALGLDRTKSRKHYPRLATVTLIACTLALSACSKREVKPGGNYYERKIAPILVQRCATSATGSLCHVTADDRGNAFGNLDVSSYEMLTKRRDLLVDYGPYGMPALLMKAVPPYTIPITHWDSSQETITTDVPHAGGSLIEPTSVSFSVLKRWLDRGATANNAEAKPPELSVEACVDRVGSDPAFDPSQDPPGADYQFFVDKVNDYLVENCAGANCHGAAQGAMTLSCGVTPEQKALELLLRQ